MPYTSPLQDIFGGGPGDWSNPVTPGQTTPRAFAGAFAPPTTSVSTGGPTKFSAKDFYNWISGLGGDVGQTGFATLKSILESQGKTDPLLFNQQLTDIMRGGAGVQQATTGALASRGLQNSGVGLALSQAQGGATENRVASARAQEAQLQEQRKRADLELLMKLFLGPMQNALSIQAGVQPDNGPTGWDKVGSILNLGSAIGLL
jgi:hypothetical protein